MSPYMAVSVRYVRPHKDITKGNQIKYTTMHQKTENVRLFSYAGFLSLFCQHLYCVHERVCVHVRAREGQRERERERKKGSSVCVCVCVHVLA